MNSWNPYNTLNLQKLEATELFQSAHRKLRENRWYKPVLDYVEELTKVNRVYTVSGFGALMIVILLLEYGTSLITGCVGFIFPAYKTLRELDTPETGVGRKWLLYWFLHAALSFFEIVFFFLSWIPGYWFFKSLFLFWCYAPMQRNGADIIYGYVIRPVFQKNREAIDNVVNQVTRTAHSIYTDSEVHTNNGHQHQN
ncbi:receptor expression-enhancing protein 5-like isoform X2 [Argiope bruennichi]|uniref:receptor expression-enhancing protein 5-like isoform X2 n=1 Tax=Argiope bruennichi TaxID=94029 RepID=UPI002494EE83|nr:receptor expression-enhancing protein 5-like isoform X2 [Argiope bruennichi]